MKTVDVDGKLFLSVRLNLAEDVCEVLHTVLEPISFKADLRLAMKPVNSETKMDISGQLEKVKVKHAFNGCLYERSGVDLYTHPLHVCKI